VDAIDAQLAGLGLALARCLPVTWVVPAFGGRALMGPIRIGFGVALAALSLPAVLAGGHASGLGPVGLALWMAREAAVGLTLALLLSVSFRAAEAAGRLIDVVRGANVAEVLAPMSGERESPASLLTGMLAVVVFLELGGLPRVAEALARSYEVLPVGGWTDALAWRGALTKVAFVTGGLLETALGLAAPVVVAVLLADVVLGLVARAAPGVPVYFVGLPLKGLLAMGVLLVSVGALRASLEVRLATLPAWRMGVLGARW
jgi:type III secretion protein SpaR/YscT/HrcT